MSEPTPEPPVEPSPTAADDATALADYDFAPLCTARDAGVPCPRKAVWFAALVHVPHPPLHGATRCDQDLLACDPHRSGVIESTAAGNSSWCPTHRHLVITTWTRL